MSKIGSKMLPDTSRYGFDYKQMPYAAYFHNLTIIFCPSDIPLFNKFIQEFNPAEYLSIS